MKFFKTFILFALLAMLIPTKSDAQLINTVVSLTGSVFDAVSREPVTCYILVTDDNEKRVAMVRSNAFQDGYYFITGLKPGNKYHIKIKKKDYFLEKYDIELESTGKYQEISRDFLIKPKTVGAKIPLPVPPFELNKSKIRYGADILLDDFKSTLLINPNVKFKIQCFPDKAGSAADNSKLTKERGNALKEYFVQNGISADRITVEGNSKTDPDNPPPTRTRAKGKRYIGPTYIVVEKF